MISGRLSRSFIRFAVAMVAVAVLATGCRDAPRIPAMETDAVILAFGDSLTRGTGAAGMGSYPARLEALTGRTVINAGVPGEVSAAGLKRLPALLDRHRPDLLLLCHGGNDLLRRLDRNRTIANLKGMIEEARKRDIPVVLIAVPQLGLLLEPAPFYAEIAATYQIPNENGTISEILSDRALKSDAIHPNATGYELLAERVAELLAESGAI